jgi:hypothetical protein
MLSAFDKYVCHEMVDSAAHVGISDPASSSRRPTAPLRGDDPATVHVLVVHPDSRARLKTMSPGNNKEPTQTNEHRGALHDG